MSKLSIALFFVMLSSTVALLGNDIFKSSDSFHHAMDSAKSNQKLLLSYAAKSTSPCCIAMEKATFNDRKVRKILKNSFYPIKVDLSTAVGKTWASNFQIVNTPTLLFFDNHGTLIKQVETCISSTELLVILEEVLFFIKNGIWPNAPDPIILTAIVPQNHKFAPAIPAGLYHKNSAIQILLDQISIDDHSIRATVEAVKLKFPKERLRIKLIEISQQSYYQVWIGNFRECQEAQILLELLKNQGFEKAQLDCSLGNGNMSNQLD